jgi:hypothetical protein
MIDLHLSAFAPRWRFLYAVRIDAYVDSIDFRPKVFKIFFYTPNYGTITGTHHLITIYHTDDFYKGNQMGCILIA